MPAPLRIGSGDSEPPQQPSLSPWQPLALGFRPFFLLAGLSALVLMVVWLLVWDRGGGGPLGYYGPVDWHAHEMLFGFGTAVIAGFLLTAVRNWTGMQTPAGLPLALLALVWLGGRVLPGCAGCPALLGAAVDWAFLPLLALALARPLWQGRNRSNRWFLVLLGAMAVANGLVHAQALGWTTATAALGIAAMLTLTLILLVFVGGRIMPFFTESALAGSRPLTRRWVELSGVSLLSVLALVQALGLTGPVPAVLLAAAGLVQLVRLAGWYDKRVLQVPLLWVLYTGYLWLVLGLLLLAASELGAFPRSGARHALTIGAIGVFMLGMMARVALGHTGRTLAPARAIVAAFVVANLAAVARVFGPIVHPAGYPEWIMASGVLWVIAFALFTAVYTPILLRRRADGRPG